MNLGNAHFRRSSLAALSGGLARRGAGRSAEIARRLAHDRTDDRVLVALAELFSGGVAGHNHEVRLSWLV
jgi:hypothetical protein